MMSPTLIDLDIRDGDILTVDAKDYPVKSIEAWVSETMRGSSVRRLAVKRAAISREVSSGKNYTRQTIIESIPCMPLDPLTKETQNRAALNTPHKLLQTIVSSEYGFYLVIVEDIKK